MKKQAKRTINIIDREREDLKSAGYKLKRNNSVFVGDEEIYWYEKRIGKYLCYYADPQDNSWEVCVITPSQEVHTLRKFKNIRDMIQSSSTVKFKI